jgi:hypothetical protein
MTTVTEIQLDHYNTMLRLCIKITEAVSILEINIPNDELALWHVKYPENQIATSAAMELRRFLIENNLFYPEY